MSEVRLIYLADMREHQNVGATDLLLTECEQFFQLLEEDGIVLLPLVLHQNRVFQQSWLGAHIGFDSGIVVLDRKCFWVLGGSDGSSGDPASEWLALAG